MVALRAGIADWRLPHEDDRELATKIVTAYVETKSLPVGFDFGRAYRETYIGKRGQANLKAFGSISYRMVC
jgi:hypothetical protein